MNHSISLTVNGVRRDIALTDPRATLLDLLREQLDLTGTKKGCDRGQCGACTILVDGRRINSCLALAISHDGADITTIEGVARGDELHPLQAAFIAHDGFQCGFCTPGQIMSALGLINEGQAGCDAERIRELAELLDLAPVDGFIQRLAGGEVAIERADADAGAPGDVFQRRVRPAFRERRLRRRQQPLAVPQAVVPGLARGTEG